MAKIIITWELGSGYGHITTFMQIARELAQRSHQVYCIVKELHHLATEQSSPGITLLQAPVWQKEIPQSISSCYAELLFNIGYYDSLQIRGKITAWRSLYNLIQPDLLITDHSPTALLASRGLSFPKATMGSGFFTPPTRKPVPAYYTDANLSDEQLLHLEQKILSTVNPALTKLEIPEIRQLSDIYQTDHAFFCTYKEMDHYPTREAVEYLGAQYELHHTETAVWPTHGGDQKIFAYLKTEFTEIEKLLLALKLTEASIIVHIPNMPDILKEKYAAPHINYYSKAVNLDKAAAQANLAICHAGHGTVANMLSNACPLLLVPLQMEQLVLSQRMKDFGAADVICLNDPVRNYRKTIKRVMNNPDYRHQAKKFSDRYSGLNTGEQCKKITDRCEALLKKRK